MPGDELTDDARPAVADDIVTRLREYEAIADNAYVINALVSAADEIERLRSLLGDDAKGDRNAR